MNTSNGLSYMQVIRFAVFTELILIAVQFGAAQIYLHNNPGGEAAFGAGYMKSTGFYIFLVGGFYLYTFLLFMLLKRIKQSIFKKLMAFVITGAIMELSFYLFIQASYEGAFLYSIFDKVIAAAFALILFNIITDEARKPEAYF